MARFGVVLMPLMAMLLPGSIALGQALPPTTYDDQMGQQAYKSYDAGDIDSIGLTSGTLSLNFPFLSYPQRGKLKFSFNLLYNNQPQHLAYYCVPKEPNECAWLWRYLPPTLGNEPLPLEKGAVYVGWAQQVAISDTLTCQSIPCGGPYEATDSVYATTWFAQLADGSKHQLGDEGSVNNVVEGTVYYANEAGPFETVDATGWRVNTALFDDLSATAAATIAATPIIGPDGVSYGVKPTDPNGNYITTPTSSIPYFTDTLGRQVSPPPTASSSGNTSTASCPVLAAPNPAVSFAVLWTPPEYNGETTNNYVFCYAPVVIYSPETLWTGQQGALSLTQTALQSIVLPNGQTWKFEYNDPGNGSTQNGHTINYGSLTRITLPTGGTISYTYTTVNFESTACQNGGRWVASRVVNANDGAGSHSWSYAYVGPSGQSGGYTTVTDPLNNVVVHTFGYPTGSYCEFYETQTQYYQGSQSPGNLLKTVNTGYSSAVYSDSSSPVAVLPTSISTSWGTNGPINKTTKTYDAGFTVNETNWANGISGTVSVPYGKVVTQTDYDYPSGTTPLRTISTSYAWQSNSQYQSNNLLDLPSEIAVFAGTGSSGACGANGAIACTTYGYDGSGLQPSGVSEQHVLNFESSPGNATSVDRWLNGTTMAQTPCTGSVSNGYLISSKVYFDTGEVDTSTDPCGYTTTYQYSSTYFGALPTTVTNALGQITTYTYDPDTSLVLSMKDPNGQTSGLQTAYTYDNMRRLTEVNYPDGGQTTACYTDMGGSTCTQAAAPYKVVVTTAISSSSPVLNETSTIVFDGLGRVSQTQLNSDPISADLVDTTYDAVGRKSTVSNPHRSTSSPTDGITTYVYDALSRVCVIVQPDGTVVSSCPTTAPAGDIFTSYAAFPCTTVTDEAGKARKSCVDGLGRMTGVWEDPSGLDYQTTYTYDALNNLLSVTQNGNNSANARIRTFTYDSLSRLACAANPEVQAVTCPSSVGTYPAGAIAYKYDNDGNLVSKTAPSPNQAPSGNYVTTSYTYDTLNRLTAKSYKDSYTSNPATPPVTYGYDGVNLSCPTPIGDVGTSGTNVIGRRSAMCYAAGSKSWTFDPMGRVHAENDRFVWIFPPYSADVVTYNGAPLLSEDTAYSYYLNGDLSQVLYPGPHGPPDYEFYTNENAAGQVTSAGDIYYTVLYNAMYAPTGQLASAEVGWTDGSFTGNVITNTYNNRLQPVLVSAATPSGAQILNLTYNFNLGSGDNGDVIQIANGKNSNRTQNFLYDPLNRIWQAYTNGTNWGETYSPTAQAAGTAFSSANAGIDAWGNLTNISGVTGKTDSESLVCAAANNQNQLSTCFTYDAAGNLIKNGTETYFYDAENRIIATAALSYVYDGDGNRVEKCTEGATPGTCASSSTGMLYWLHTGGGTLAESDLGGNWSAVYGLIHGQITSRVDLPTPAVSYYFHDYLNSTNVVTNATGTIECESDYDPYGGEMPITSCSSNRYKFTGKERDSESGLDNFGKRYDASSLGRFMTTDPVVITTERLQNPQQLNLYAYVANNPLRFIDPTGEILQCVGDAKSQSQCFADLQQIAGDAKDRLSMDAKTGVISFDTKDLDLSKNEGASLVNNLVGSKNTYDFSVGPTIMTDKGPVRVDHIGTDMANLPAFGDQRQIGNPPAGVSDILDIYFNNPNMTRVSNTNLQVAPEWTVAFHELAEAYEKIDGGKGGSYAAGHNAALQREMTLRDQRPYLKQYNTGAGGPANSPNPQGGIIIKQ